MKRLLIKSFSSVLAVLVLFSTFSFTVEEHFCGDFLVDVSLLGETEKCDSGHIDIDCCKDEVITVEGQDILQQQVVKNISFKAQEFLAAYIHYFIGKDEFSENENYRFESIPPPKLSKSFQVSYQCFLI